MSRRNGEAAVFVENNIDILDLLRLLTAGLDHDCHLLACMSGARPQASAIGRHGTGRRRNYRHKPPASRIAPVPEVSAA